MERNRKLLISSLIAFFVLTASSTEVLGANAPIPNNQTWDNFSLNSSFIKPKTINTKQTEQQKILEIKPDSQPVIKQIPMSNLSQPKSNAVIPAEPKKELTQPKEIVQTKAPVLTQEKMPLLNQEKTTVITQPKPITEIKDNTQAVTEEKTTVMTQDKLDALEDIRNQAKLLYNANKPEEALKAFQQIPDSEKVSDDWLYLANLAQDNGKDMDAIFYLKKAIQVDNNNYKAHYNLGNLYLSDEKANMAIDEYNKAIKVKKDFSYAYYNKGCAYLKKNSYFNAKYEFGLAIKYNPDEPAFYYNLAYTYKMMNKEKKANDALEIYEKLMHK